MKKTLALFAAAALLAATGCHFQESKNADGTEKNVRIDTPIGGLHVRAGNTTAADVGLPAYPGATVVPDKDGDKSADVHMGFGKWQLRVQVVNYQTSDPQDKVLAFYQKALGRYGDVIRCQNGRPVGTSTVTGEGLSCSNDHIQTNVNLEQGLLLKAGSRHHQHILGIEKNDTPGTRFALIELQLPTSLDSEGKSQ